MCAPFQVASYERKLQNEKDVEEERVRNVRRLQRDNEKLAEKIQKMEEVGVLLLHVAHKQPKGGSLYRRYFEASPSKALALASRDHWGFTQTGVISSLT